jgi:alpha-1,3-rhamnosyltransferase
MTSVLLPVYNGADYIEESIISILKQKGDWELIIQDDCSSDTTELICKNYLSEKVKYFKNDIKCYCFGTLNAAAFNANGELIRLFSHDDIMLDNDLINSANFLKNNPDIGICFTNYDMIDSDGNITGSSLNYIERNNSLPDKMNGEEAARHLFRWGCIAGSQSNITLRREVYNHMGGFNDKMLFVGDFDLLVRAAIPYGLGYCRQKTCRIRFHPLQTSNEGLKSKKKNSELKIILDFLFSVLKGENYINAKRQFSKIYGYQMMINPIKLLLVLNFKPLQEFYLMYGFKNSLQSIYYLCKYRIVKKAEFNR